MSDIIKELAKELNEMKDKPLISNQILFVIFGLISVVHVTIADGWILTVLWDWFIFKYTNMHIDVWSAVGILVTIKFLISDRNLDLNYVVQQKLKELTRKEKNMFNWTKLLVANIIPYIVLFSGWIYYNKFFIF